MNTRFVCSKISVNHVFAKLLYYHFYSFATNTLWNVDKGVCVVKDLLAEVQLVAIMLVIM